MTEGKAIKRAKGLNNLTKKNPNVTFDVVGSGDDCYVRQINKSATSPGEENYGVAAY